MFDAFYMCAAGGCDHAIVWSGLERDQRHRIGLGGSSVRVAVEYRAPDGVPHTVVLDNGQNRQLQGFRNLVAGSGVGEHVGAVADASDNETFAVGELRAK